MDCYLNQQSNRPVTRQRSSPDVKSLIELDSAEKHTLQLCSFYLISVLLAEPIFTAGMHICISKSPALVLTGNKIILPGYAYARAPLTGPSRAKRNLRYQFVNCRQKKRSLQSSIESSRPKPLTISAPGESRAHPCAERCNRSQQIPLRIRCPPFGLKRDRACSIESLSLYMQPPTSMDFLASITERFLGRPWGIASPYQTIYTELLGADLARQMM